MFTKKLVQSAKEASHTLRAIIMKTISIFDGNFGKRFLEAF